MRRLAALTFLARPKPKGVLTDAIVVLTKIALDGPPDVAMAATAQIDEACRNVLKEVEQWVDSMVDWLGKDTGRTLVWEGMAPQCNPQDNARGMLYRRFNQVRTSVRELYRQIDFRRAGGYSDKPANEVSLAIPSTWT